MEQFSYLSSRYTVGALLGQGGMGAVYRAFDKVLSQEVALKILRPDKKETFGSFFRSEIRAAAQLCHPNIVPIYDASQKDPPYLAMRYASGGSLSLWVQSPPPWEVLLKGVSQLLDALAFAHARGMLHRDLKPENILLTEQGDTLLADLGLALSLEQVEKALTTSQEVYGTPRYMAPEQFLGSPSALCPATDLYALGVILYEVVSGQRPFRGEPNAVFSMKKHAPHWTVRAGLLVPDGLQQVIERLLRFEPSERYELAADVKRALLALNQKSTLTSGWDEVTVQSPISALRNEESLALLQASPPEDPRSEEATRASLALFPIRDFGLVGRAPEKQTLWGLSREVLSSGSPRFVLLEGEAGVGKSRLLRWLRENLEQRGVARRVLVREEEPKLGSFVGLEGAAHRLLQSFHLSQEEIRHKALLFLGGARDEASAIASWLAPQTNQEPLSSVERDLLFFQLLSREAYKRGMVLVNWENIPRAQGAAGLSTIERALSFYHNTQEPTPTLFVATARPEDWASSSGAALRERLLSRPETTLIHLERLDTRTQSRLIEERAPVTKELSVLVAARSEGNPLYAVELLKHWVLSGYLTPTSRGKYQLKPGADIKNAAPASLTSLSQDRLKAAISRAESPSLASDALSLAAMLGLEPARDVLVWALSRLQGEDASQEGLDVLLREGFLRVMPQTQELRFDHALLHSISLGYAEKRRDASSLHRLCAESLEGSRSDAATLSAAASHWEKCDEVLKATQCFLRAGERLKFSDLARADEAYQNSIRLARTLDSHISAVLIAEANVYLGRIARLRGQLENAKQHFNIGLTSSDTAVRIVALLGLSSIGLQSRDLVSAESYATEANHLAEKIGERSSLALSWQHLGMVYLKRGLLEEAEKALDLAQSGARSAKEYHYLTGILRWVAQLKVYQGTPDKALPYIEEASRLALSLGATGLYAQLQNELGEIARNQGRFEEARQAYLSYRSLSQKLGRQQSVMLSEIQLALVSLLMNDLPQGKKHLQSASMFRSFGAYWQAPLALVGSWVSALESDHAHAAQLLSESVAHGIDKEAIPDTALVFEKIGDASTGALSTEAYSLALSQWRRLTHTKEADRTAAKLANRSI